MINLCWKGQGIGVDLLLEDPAASIFSICFYQENGGSKYCVKIMEKFLDPINPKNYTIWHHQHASNLYKNRTKTCSQMLLFFVSIMTSHYPVIIITSSHNKRILHLW